MSPPRILFVACLALQASVFAADPEFLGAAACAACHPAQAAAQSESAHARSLSRPSDHRLAASFPTGDLVLTDGPFQYRLAYADQALEVRVSSGADVLRQAVDWAFGAGDQAVTFVSRLDDDWYLEHHLSYYAKPDRLSLTPGHQSSEPQDLGQALGVRYQTFSPASEILRCFRCHSTGPLALGEGFAIEPAQMGVRCESCHGPGAAHVQAVASGRVDQAAAAIENPGRLAPLALLERCGGCHRPPGSDPAQIDYRDPWNVRHQPVYLSRSACFTQSADLTCMTCHDPHEKVRLNDREHYNAQCIACHQPAEACAPAATTACASCHMPKTEPQQNLAFTNHWIAVYEPGKPLEPRKSP